MRALTILVMLLAGAAMGNAQPLTLAEAFAQPAHVTADELSKKKPGREPRYVLKCVIMDQRINQQCMAVSGGWNLILNPSGPALWPQGLERERLRAGDEVEVSGYLNNSELILQMNDVVYRVIGRDRPTPVPIELQLSDVDAYPHRCDLVRLTAPLGYVIRQFEGGYHTVRFQVGEGRDIIGIVATPKELLRDQIPDDCMIELTGFLTREEDGSSYIWMRTPEDVRVVGLGPDAVRRLRLKWGLGIFLVVAAIGLWIFLLRRQVRWQTTKLRQANDRLKSSEAELIANLAREKEVSDLKSNFVSMVSHEFRTPLAVILSSTELLRNHMDQLNEEMRRTQMDNIVQSTVLMSGMIEEVLLLGKVEGGRMVCAPVDLDLAGFAAVLVDEGLSATKQRCPIQLTVNDEVRGQAKGDPALLRHIFSNLLSNAAKYSPEGSVITFTIVRDGDYAVCTVRDNGIGIPEPDRARLFEAFHRAGNVGQRTGTGLGLVIVKRCVDLHGGSIEVDSIEHGGTTVIVRLPLFAPTANLPQSLP
jgi:signal transduction histidine kinase